MLTATFRGSTQPHQMHPRGRSRHISPVAIARQASEERRHRATPPSPPPPPQSLEDQIQVAYANDDIRLAKALLLKLKGIHVSDHSDPRIDQVRDEDFDMCFAPSGPLTLDEADKRAIQETQRRQRQWWHESQRAQRLRACEQLWEHEKTRLHQDKLRAIQRREQDQDRCRRHTENTAPSRAMTSRVETPPPSKRGNDPFRYAFMLPPKPSAPAPKSIKKPRSPGRNNRSVSFKDVINAMNGQLFPLDASERVDDARRITGLPIPNSSHHRRKASVHADLLNSLLQVVEWQDGERRKAKGKEAVRDQQKLPATTSPTPLPSVPSSLSAASLSSSPARSGSWLTFGSWRSTATDITTPESPVTGSPVTSQPCLPTLIETQREHHPRSAFVRISVEDTPLCPPIISQHGSASHDDTTSCATALGSPPEISPSICTHGTLVTRVTRSVATIVEVAKGLQSAYLTATMFTAGSPYPDSPTSPLPRGHVRCQWQTRQEGYRALAKDVRKFTDCSSSISQITEPVHFIPLMSQSSGSAGLPKPCLPKDAVIFPSPLRPRTPPAALAYRMRPVANPAVLRLRALQNVMCARGKEWEGRGREGGLGCGKERMVGIAFEGRGRSGLGCEVRFVVA